MLGIPSNRREWIENPTRHHIAVDAMSDETFDKAIAINSMQVWPDRSSRLRKIRRVLKPGGSLGLGFTKYSGKSKGGIAETLAVAGFANTRIVEWDDLFCAVASRH